ncbi:uncharacterized protein FA14DRAFT_153501 [Meira miltonrushii]|uniref:Uncharacterized protein n=1 Tax=Meira miltonrushii TaxID=1280837 RepID=A0A316VPT9_9BASI|nr:uncharacterized protein FA14DRAFT_153501 [Meira miltonrushii]PWN38171.1 hypothetical protein FA14DRAFT_153501 [Meira miltonrushii]
MSRIIVIHFAALLLLFLFGLGTLAMKGDRIEMLDGSHKRLSAKANTPNPNLDNLSVHGKKVENLLTKHDKSTVVHDRVFESWWNHADAENNRNREHSTMNMHAEEIESHEKKKKSIIGRVRSKIPILSKKDEQKGIALHQKFNHAKQKKDKYRQVMREVASDAAIHHKAGNFVDHDVRYVTQMNFDNSSELGYRSDGRHVTTAPNSPPGSPKLTRSGSGSSRKTVGTST